MEAIAIVGIGCRFPGGASDPGAFWRNLCDGVDAITETPPDRWDVDALYDPVPQRRKVSTRWGGYLDGVDLFDAEFFRIGDEEAATVDPQHRLVLEVGWEALEDAAIVPAGLAGSRTGVFVGISNYDYNRLLARDRGYVDKYSAVGTIQSVAPNRLSYFLNLQGPSLAIDTACSSSLVTVHLACDSLRSGQCDLALAGGVNVILAPEVTISFSQAGLMSPVGRCKSFDASADGYVRGDGCGMVVLKRLADALADGDRVVAVLRGSAVNHDGRSNGLIAPRGPAQQAVIREALAAAGVDPGEIGYLEAHGTGTRLGDIIEMRSLKAVLADGRSADRRMAIGCVKSNIGHAESAAGIAGLIKVAMSLEHEEIPPNLHFEKPDPSLKLDRLPFFIPVERHPWPRGNGPRLAGVSSFGIGGTNGFALLEEAPARPAPEAGSDRPAHVLTLSAKNLEALRAQARNFRRFLEEDRACDLADVCYTANAGRTHFNHCLALVAEDRASMVAGLAAFEEGRDAPGLHVGEVKKRKATTDAADPETPESVARRYVEGAAIDWAAIHGGARRKVSLPTYPFQRRRYWMDQVLEAERLELAGR